MHQCGSPGELHLGLHSTEIVEGWTSIYSGTPWSGQEVKWNCATFSGFAPTLSQVEVMEERKTDQEVASEAGEGSRQVEQHESENASSVGESEMKAELVTTTGKEL